MKYLLLILLFIVSCAPGIVTGPMPKTPTVPVAPSNDQFVCINNKVFLITSGGPIEFPVGKYLDNNKKKKFEIKENCVIINLR